MSEPLRTQLSRVPSAGLILPFEGGRKPDWFCVDDTRIQAVRRILDPDIWNCSPFEVPFEKPKYLETKLPLRVGSMDKSFDAIYSSVAYRLAKKCALPYMREFSRVSSENFERKIPKFLCPTLRQMMEADRLIFGTESDWHFSVRITYVKKMKFQKHPRGMEHQYMHRDGHKRYNWSVNNPGRGWITSDIATTKFEDSADVQPRDLTLFMLERHAAGRMLNAGVRCTIRGNSYIRGVEIPLP